MKKFDENNVNSHLQGKPLDARGLTKLHDVEGHLMAALFAIRDFDRLPCGNTMTAAASAINALNMKLKAWYVSQQSLILENNRMKREYRL